MQQHRLRKHHD